MDLPPWGTLPKASDDPTVIDAAIAAAISAHNDNPDSHLGAGQSLQSHRASEIIDHLASSVVADKFTDRQMMFLFNFETLDDWTVSAFLSSIGFPGCIIGTDDVLNDEATLIAASSGLPSFFDVSKNLLFQVNARVDVATDVEFYLDWGVYSDNMVGESAFGFRFVSSQLQAFFHDGTSFHTSDISSVDISLPHIYRVVIDSTLKNLYFYIDSVLVATLSYTSWSYSEDRSASFQIKALSVSSRRLYLFNLLMARDI